MPGGRRGGGARRERKATLSPQQEELFYNVAKEQVEKAIHEVMNSDPLGRCDVTFLFEHLLARTRCSLLQLCCTGKVYLPPSIFDKLIAESRWSIVDGTYKLYRLLPHRTPAAYFTYVLRSWFYYDLSINPKAFENCADEYVLEACGEPSTLIMSQADVWVRERRLRPLYELLDSGNNKKVLPEVDRVLKKQPGLTCAKVLKALALIRMNKPTDARAILDPIVEDIPTDDGTIQALSICYRELEEPVTICRVLEAACKKDQSEELLTHCFMAQARICEYHKQHLTAMTLYKLYNKATYFGWAIASMFVKAERLPDSGANVRILTLQVAERMLLKFTTEAINTVDENIMYLYFSILSLQEKWTELLHIMELHGYPMPKFNNDDVHELYCHALNSVNKREELFGYLKDMFMQRVDEIHILRQMINLFAESNPDWVLEFFDKIRNRYPSRIIAVADLLYFSVYACPDKAYPRIAEDLNMICEYAVEKPSMFDDVECFLDCLPTEESKQNFLQRVKLPNGDKEDTIPIYESVGKVIRDVNYELVERSIYPDLDPLARMRRAHRCVRKYLQAEIDMAALRADDNLKTKESDSHDQFFVIAATTLLTKYDEPVHDFDGIVKTVLSLNEPWSESNDLNAVAEELMHFLNIDKESGEKRQRQRKRRAEGNKGKKVKPLPGTYDPTEFSESEPEEEEEFNNANNGELENQMKNLDLEENNGKTDSSEVSAESNDKVKVYDETIELQKLDEDDSMMSAFRELNEVRRERFAQFNKKLDDEAALYNFEDETRMETDVNSWNHSLEGYALQGQLKTDKPYVLRDDEYLIMTALNLMEYGLHNCPYNHSLRILLARAYIRVGAVRRALTIFQGLDLKHVQWDSLGYLFLPRLVSGGLFADALKTLTIAESMYTGYKRECMEHIITAYKFGNFSKIKEFTSFRDMLINSMQYGVISMEKKMLEYLLATTAPELQQLAETVESEIPHDLLFAQLIHYADNRDFTVIPLVGVSIYSSCMEKTKKNSYAADLLQYRLKHGLLLLITKMVVVMTDPNGPALTPENTVQIGKLLEHFKIATLNVRLFTMENGDAKYLYGIWPHKTHRYKELECFDALINQFDCALELMEPKIESKQPILAALARMISDDVNVQLRRLNETLRSLTLLTVGQAMEDTQCMLEALSMSRLIFWVCLLLIKNKHEKNKTGKKKKSRNESEVKKEYASAVHVMEETVNSVLVYFAQFEKALQNFGPFKWAEAEAHWANSIGWCFRTHIFPTNFDNIQQYICESHYIQMMEMKHVAENMVEFLQSLI